MKFEHISVADIVPEREESELIREIWVDGDNAADLAHVVVEADSKTDLEWHDRTSELYVVINGSATLAVDGVETQLSSGSVAVIPPKARHQLLTDAEPLEFYCVSVPAYDPQDVHRVN